jgi:GNAT superfamily N-acetyltransferase
MMNERMCEPERDVKAIVEIDNACWEQAGVEFRMQEDELRNDWMHFENFKPQRDCAVWECDGVVAAYGSVAWHIDDEGRQLFMLDGRVHPRMQRRGFGAAVLAWQEAHARAAAQPDRAHALQTTAIDGVDGEAALMQSCGFAPVRRTVLMLRDLREPIPDLPLPDGLIVRPPERDELRRLHEARNEAFRDHWGHREFTEADYAGLLSDPLVHPEWWQVAWDANTGEPAAAVHVKIYEQDNEYYGVRRGWTDPVWVRRPWRRRGVARVLLARAFAQLCALGMNEASLTADSQNLSGATKLYESMGFRTTRGWTKWRKAI